MARKIIIEGENGNYGAYVPCLMGCTSAGDSVEATKKNILEAIEMHVDLMQESGVAIPDLSDGFIFEIDALSRPDFWFAAMTSLAQAGFTPNKAKWDEITGCYIGTSAGVRPRDDTRACHYKIFLKQSDANKHIHVDLWFSEGTEDERKNLVKEMCKAGSFMKEDINFRDTLISVAIGKRAFDGEKDNWEATIAWLVKTISNFDKNLQPYSKAA